MQQKDLNPELKPSYENIYANVHFVKRGLDVMLNSLSYSTQNWIKKKLCSFYHVPENVPSK